MSRRILSLIVLLLGGLALNVGVAWGLVWLFAHSIAIGQVQTMEPPPSIPSDDLRAIWEEEFGPSVFVTDANEVQHMTSAPRTADLGSSVFMLRPTMRDGLGCSSISLNDELRQAPVSMEILRAGWPLPTLRCERVFRPKKYAIRHGWQVFTYNASRAGGLALPCKPMWTGVVVNTFVYAALLLALRFAVMQTKAALRRRRGLCAACGYDMRASPDGVCPECGSRRAGPIAAT